MAIFRKMRDRIIHIIDEFITWVKFGIAMFIIIFVIYAFVVPFFAATP